MHRNMEINRISEFLNMMNQFLRIYIKICVLNRVEANPFYFYFASVIMITLKFTNPTSNFSIMFNSLNNPTTSQ